ncbi:MAG: type II toxin-antitoxin system VapC family toxin [Thermoguttaceae bacterium]|jgi:hypothetical protein
MKASVYSETTIPSFIVARMSPVLVTAGRQLITRQWWDEQRENYRLYISSVVEAEIVEGDTAFAEQRLALVAEVPRLYITDEVTVLADEFFRRLRLPDKARNDAVHLALACYFEVDYLLTWNLTHLANGHVQRVLAHLYRTREMAIPIICTPEQLMQWRSVP